MRYKGGYKEGRQCELKQNLKNRRSSDCRLKLICMKLESLVIVNQHVTVNDLSNFAHTAHHARRVVSAGHLLHYVCNLIPGIVKAWRLNVDLARYSAKGSDQCSL